MKKISFKKGAANSANGTNSANGANSSNGAHSAKGANSGKTNGWTTTLTLRVLGF